MSDSQIRDNLGEPYCVVRGLEEPEEDIIEPEVVEMVVSNFITPYPQHAVEGDKNREEVGDHEHPLRRSIHTPDITDLPAGTVGAANYSHFKVLLNVPKGKR